MEINVHNEIMFLDKNDTLEEIAAATHMTTTELIKYIYNFIAKKEGY